MAYIKCLRNVISSTAPDGKTVTPTDIVATWLACGSRTEKYTTLSAVLADSTCLNALMASNNAVDYLVRSTTFASDITSDSGAMTAIGLNNYCANTLLGNSTWCEAICNSTYFESVLNVKVPVMTSNTTPSGQCFGDSVYAPVATRDYYRAFDNDINTPWGSENGANAYIGYKFTSQKKIYVFFARYGNGRMSTVKFQGSNNGSNWSDISGVLTKGSVPFRYVKFNPTLYQYYRLYVVSASAVRVDSQEVQFYGRADV